MIPRHSMLKSFVWTQRRILLDTRRRRWRLGQPTGLWVSLGSAVHYATGQASRWKIILCCFARLSVEKSPEVSILALFLMQQIGQANLLHVFFHKQHLL